MTFAVPVIKCFLEGTGMFPFTYSSCSKMESRFSTGMAYTATFWAISQSITWEPFTEDSPFSGNHISEDS